MKRVLGAYAWRRLLDAHARLAFGSGFPVEHANPLLGLYAAITRQGLSGQPPGGWLPDQRITTRRGSAGIYLGQRLRPFDEQRLGELRPGMQCDVSVFDRDLAAVAPRDIARAQALATVIGGEVVLSRK